jgi:hypothetical protein
MIDPTSGDGSHGDSHDLKLNRWAEVEGAVGEWTFLSFSPGSAPEEAALHHVLAQRPQPRLRCGLQVSFFWLLGSMFRVVMSLSTKIKGLSSDSLGREGGSTNHRAEPGERLLTREA